MLFPPANPIGKIPGGAFIPSVLISYTQNKTPLFLAEYCCCTKNKISVFKGFIFLCRLSGAWKSICPKSHQSDVQPKMPPLSPGMGHTPWDAQKGPGGKKQSPQADTVLPGVPPVPLLCHSGTQPCHSAGGCECLFYSQWRKIHIEPILENSWSCFGCRSECCGMLVAIIL